MSRVVVLDRDSIVSGRVRAEGETVLVGDFFPDRFIKRVVKEIDPEEEKEKFKEKEREIKDRDESLFSEVFEILESFPTDLIGDWIIGGVTYTTDKFTRFKEDNGVFVKNGCVSVRFETLTNKASDISTENSRECS